MKEFIFVMRKIVGGAALCIPFVGLETYKGMQFSPRGRAGDAGRLGPQMIGSREFGMFSRGWHEAC